MLSATAGQGACSNSHLAARRRRAAAAAVLPALVPRCSRRHPAGRQSVRQVFDRRTALQAAAGERCCGRRSPQSPASRPADHRPPCLRFIGCRRRGRRVQLQLGPRKTAPLPAGPIQPCDVGVKSSRAKLRPSSQPGELRRAPRRPCQHRALPLQCLWLSSDGSVATVTLDSTANKYGK